MSASFKSTPPWPAARTTGIGSLPHPNVDSALAFSFRHDIPYLPQIPIRNSWEYMIPQALEGLPGLSVASDGSATLDENVWTGRTRWLDERLLEAFTHAPGNAEAFAPFEPGSAQASLWQPFLWEIGERRTPVAKIQIAGPLTAQWSLRLRDGTPGQNRPELGTQIFRLVLARAMAMCRRVRSVGAQPLLFIDEPGLYGLSPQNPRHAVGLAELKLVIQALRKDGAWVGLHCCSNTDWAAVLGLGMDVLSIDAGHSLDHLLAAGHALETFVAGGGKLSLGVIPTPREPGALRALDAGSLFTHLLARFEQGHVPAPRVRAILADALYTPACGLAFHAPEDAESCAGLLADFRALVERLVSDGRAP